MNELPALLDQPALSILDLAPIIEDRPHLA